MSIQSSKKQVFYVHGGSAYSKYESFLDSLKNKDIRNFPWSEKIEKWPATLRSELGDEYEVFMPEMPNSHNAKYNEWKIWFERHFEYLRDDVVLVGWSQGGYFLSKYLTENNLPVKVKALFLVAAPIKPEDFGDEDGGDFSFDTSRVEELAEKIDNIHIFHSQDDFCVPYEHALLYKESLPKAELISFSEKNHFLIEEFPELIEQIKSLDW